jgi:hypothetical protein
MEKKISGFLSVPAAIAGHVLRKSAPELKSPLSCLDLMQRKSEQFPDLIAARSSMPDLDSSVVLGLSASPFKTEVIQNYKDKSDGFQRCMTFVIFVSLFQSLGPA